jgi:hypothetical protein
MCERQIPSDRGTVPRHPQESRQPARSEVVSHLDTAINSQANIQFMIADTPPLSGTRADGLPMRGPSLRGRQNTVPLVPGDRRSPPGSGGAGRGGGRQYTF